MFNQEDEARSRFWQQNTITSESAYQANLATAKFGWMIDFVRAADLCGGARVRLSSESSPGACLSARWASFLRTSNRFYRPIRTTMKEMTGTERHHGARRTRR